jgi:hypothetical protein
MSIAGQFMPAENARQPKESKNEEACKERGQGKQKQVFR